MVMTPLVRDVQVNSLSSFLVGGDDILRSSPVVATWLFSLPQTSITITPDAVKSAFYMHIRIDCPAIPGGSNCEHFFIPEQFLPETGVILGTTFCRFTAGHSDFYPECYQADPSVLLHDARYDASLSHFALDLECGRMLQSTFAPNGAVAFYEFLFSDIGIAEQRVAHVKADGSISALRNILACQFCTAVGTRCSCSSSMRRRMQGSSVKLDSWGQLLELGRKRFQGANAYVVAAVDGVSNFESGEPDWVEVADMQFDPDWRIEDIRFSYLTHMVLRNSDLTLSSSLATTNALPDEDWFASDIQDLVVQELDNVSLEDLATTDTPPPAEKTKKPECPVCGQQFARFHNMRRHVQSAHRGKKEYACDICMMRFTQASNRDRHKRVVHEGCRPHVCATCGAAFGTTANLRRHEGLKHRMLESRAAVSTRV